MVANYAVRDCCTVKGTNLAVEYGRLTTSEATVYGAGSVYCLFDDSEGACASKHKTIDQGGIWLYLCVHYNSLSQRITGRQVLLYHLIMLVRDSL